MHKTEEKIKRLVYFLEKNKKHKMYNAIKVILTPNLAKNVDFEL